MGVQRWSFDSINAGKGEFKDSLINMFPYNEEERKYD